MVILTSPLLIAERFLGLFCILVVRGNSLYLSTEAPVTELESVRSADGRSEVAAKAHV